MDNRPIGMFDSGLGGISVLMSAARLLPNEDFIFYGDNQNAPYGNRTEAEITELTLHCAHELIRRGVKAIVVACNTATATCIRTIRELLDVPVVSVEPAIKPACEAEGDGKVLMMATLATTRMDRYLRLQSRMPDPSRVINVPCPALAARIEQGVFAADAYDDLLDEYLGPYADIVIDGIVLGCTHYIFIRDAIARYAAMRLNGACRIYDGNDATARQLSRVLSANGLEHAAGGGEITFITSGDDAVYRPMFELLFYNGKQG